MSVSDGKTQQSSRLMYRTPETHIFRDHKDIYYKGTATGSYEGFHYLMYVADKDESVHDVLWRKMFPDRYFTYVSTGMYEWAGQYGLCYPEQRVKSNTQQVLYNRVGLFYTEKYVLFQAYDKINIADEDGRVFVPLDFEYDLTKSGNLLIGAGKGGFIWWEYELRDETYYHSYYFVELGDDKDVAEKHFLMTKTAQSSSQVISVFGDPQSNYVLYRSESSKWGFINTKYIRIYPEYPVFTSNNPVFLDGTWYLTGYFYANDEYYIAISELHSDGQRNFHTLDDYHDRNFYWTTSLIYNDGDFYLYAQPTSQATLMMFKGHSIDSLEQIELPEAVTLYGLDGESTFTYRLNASYVGVYNEHFRLGNNDMSNPRFQKYEDNKKVFNVDWMIGSFYRYSANPNNLICYFDSLTFEESEHNLFLYNSDTGAYGNMWDHYYS